MNVRNLLVACALLAFTLLGFYVFPGHTYLQADTQIYLPMLERLWTPGALGNDLVATHPHMAFTIYDEVAIFLRRLTGLDFQHVLALEQLILRFLGLVGAYLIARSLQFAPAGALLAAGFFSLGATVVGPSVLTIEYEPVPRGFAIPLLLLAIGLEAHERCVPAGLAVAAAFLFHPPTVYPFLAVYFVLMLLPREPKLMWRRILGIVPLILAVLLLFPLARMQPGETERQILLGKLDPSVESLQRMRASYNWISIWWKDWIWNHLFLAAAAWIALARFWNRCSESLRLLWLGMPLVGLLCMPVSYLLLESWKWSLLPQFQPLRAILFVTAFAVIGSACAAVDAAARKRYLDSFLWFFAALAVPAQLNINILGPSPWNAQWSVKLLVVAALAALAVLACIAAARWSSCGSAAALATIALSMAALAGPAAVPNYAVLHHAELDQLSEWARTHTPAASIFHFPDAGRDLYPGVFRARAVRAIYVDWKSGGQVNYLKRLGEEWHRRWSSTLAKGYVPAPPEQFASLRVDYLVLKTSSPLPPDRPVFRNGSYAVYEISR